jgi:hypothetical protein
MSDEKPKNEAELMDKDLDEATGGATAPKVSPAPAPAPAGIDFAGAGRTVPWATW